MQKQQLSQRMSRLGTETAYAVSLEAKQLKAKVCVSILSIYLILSLYTYIYIYIYIYTHTLKQFYNKGENHLSFSYW